MPFNNQALSSLVLGLVKYREKAVVWSRAKVPRYCIINGRTAGEVILWQTIVIINQPTASLLTDSDDIWNHQILIQLEDI
ncbi:hypothetical protein MGYG_01445 [Nannizzia gypsea CBS 118893]|uniref:Uncharacterized protein n=1 Tax=Arthroderma gypseum (strain ATCC MYA-4604 / CBS 118893) TaxID=535722 RepID=E5R0X3_ARTGP|nr:hypothetical protein MGYG_01445 [Nannizzia gypsea CBS 118893]EFQ98415.1 hypothetical protein MGYG_01445 [Nannizzia gypsea CBS 118893]